MAALNLVLADTAGAYRFAGILTLAAALIVVVVMLATSESKEDENP